MIFPKFNATQACLIIVVLLLTPLRAAFAGEFHNVTILQRDALSDGDYSLRMTLSLGNRLQRLLLNKSNAFADLKVIHHDSSSDLNRDSGSDITTAPLANIDTYEGIIENLPDSWVRITTDTDQVNGVIDSGTERHYITSQSRPDAHSYIRRIRQLSGAVDNAIEPPPDTTPKANRHIREVIELDVGNGFDASEGSVSRVARIAIVVDTLYDEALGGRGLAEAISTINTVDGLYQKDFGLALKVETAIMITDTTTLDLGDVSLEHNLALFRDYRVSAPELNDDLGLVHLFTGARTADPSVGLAYIGSACRTDGYDVSMSTPFDFPVLLATHEIGHNLGALHDDETDLCKLTTDQMMFSHISSLTTREFSNCSIDAINKRLNQSACHLDAIDLSLALSKNSDDSIVALITNTDTRRAFPSALFNLTLKNASIAAAPASCDIQSTTQIACEIPTTYPGESRSLEINIRFDDTQDNTLDASLEPVGFIDVKTIDNSAQILVPAQKSEEPSISIANNDDGNTTGSAEPGPTSSSAGGSSGGGSITAYDSLLLLLTAAALYRRRYASTDRLI